MGFAVLCFSYFDFEIAVEVPPTVIEQVLATEIHAGAQIT